ncbi:MAG: hypothetical protein GTN53_22860 [Candidatus Aminicenantes bacterium]|nr:hypothetical protein [Candidatus Aminicenantes bacterium]NIQ69346.1 hypothetical protein [Candidatus Aminicenantes bacterium]NIT25346.1 hypothetical protein [Candidatus Aminicenantes bacterium]
MNRVDNSTATPGGWSDSGDTSIGSPVISNLASTGAVNIGDYVIVGTGTEGFPDVGLLRVIAKTVNTITVHVNATANQTGKSVQSLSGMYTDGVPGVTARTILNSKQMCLIQEEIIFLLTKGGATPSNDFYNQLSKVVITTKGGTITEPLAVKRLDLTKLVTTSQADSTENLKIYGGQYNITTLAVATAKILTMLPAGADAKPMIVQANILFTYNGSNYSANFSLAAKRGEATGPPEDHKTFIMPAKIDQGYAHASTPVNQNSIYVFVHSQLADNFYDGTDPRNESPQIIILHDRILIRNSHTVNSITNINALIKITNAD